MPKNLADLLAFYGHVAIVHNVSKIEVTFPRCLVVMRVITMNEMLMILREGR